MFTHVSEIPVLRGGRVLPEAFDYGFALNINTVEFNNRVHVYWKGIKTTPETLNPTAIGLAYVDVGFNGYNLNKYSSNPVINFGTGSWSGTILDSYTNPAVRWVESGATVVTAGSFVTGLCYEIKTVGTTNFTLIGASANTIGVKFIATGPGTGTGDAYVTDGGRHGDMSFVVFANKVHAYISVYDYNNAGSNRLALMTSTDGITFTYVQEITFSGGNFGASVGPMFVANNKLWMMCGSPKELRSSDDGLAWTSHGTAVSLSTDPGAANYRAMPIGRGWVEGTYAYVSLPMSRVETDWPEGVGVWRLPVAQLGTSNLEWEACANNPVILRQPTMGGIWQLNPFKINGDSWAFYNTWGIVGFSNINTSTSNSVRNTPYFGMNTTTFKHVGAARSKIDALDDWAAYLNVAAQYRIKNGRRYLCAASDGTVYLSETASTESVWSVARQSGFWLFKPSAYPTLALTMEPGTNFRANNRKLQVLAFSTPVAAGFDGTSASVVSVANNTITINSHGFATGDEVAYMTSGAVIGGLTNYNFYFIIKVDNNTIKLATTAANAAANTAIDLTGLAGEVTNVLATNVRFQWHLSKSSQSTFVITNRETSLSVTPACTQSTAFYGDSNRWTFARA